MIGLARYAARTRVSLRKRSEKIENLPFGLFPWLLKKTVTTRLRN
jgi:hypothetical protein